MDFTTNFWDITNIRVLIYHKQANDYAKHRIIQLKIKAEK